MYYFESGFLRSMFFGSHSRVLHISIDHSSLLLRRIPWRGCMSLSIRLSRGIWIFTVFVITNKAAMKFYIRVCVELCFHFLWVSKQEQNWSYGSCQRFPQAAELNHFVFPKRQEFKLLCILILDIEGLFNFSRFSACQQIFQCDFKLRFSDA